jgi:hypothetical protein
MTERKLFGYGKRNQVLHGRTGASVRFSRDETNGVWTYKKKYILRN